MAEFSGFVAPLFVPADRPDRFEKAARSGADATIIDLEDAVAPANKETARARLAAALPGGTVLVRINARGTPWHEDDLQAVTALAAAGMMVPKADDPAYLARLAEKLGPEKPLVALIETAAGVDQATAVAAVPGLSQLAFGPADLTNDLGCGDTREALLAARSAVVLASRLAGIPAPIDGPTFTVEPEATADDARYARTLGFGGKLCIHPKQVAPVRAAFLPTEEEISWAERVVAAGTGGQAALLDGAMIDAPIVARAERILARRERR